MTQHTHMNVQEAVKDLALVALSLIFLPLDLVLVAASQLYNAIIPAASVRHRHANCQNAAVQPRVILVTGVGMSKGLTLARAFYETGHTVIGADFDSAACGRVSASLSCFGVLRRPDPSLGAQPYIEGLVKLIVAHKVDLWVSCSGVASAAEDGEAKEVIEAKTKCRAIQFDLATTRLLHEKHTFIDHTRRIGLVVPDTHTVSTAASAQDALAAAPYDRKYIMKPIGMDDANRGDMTLLPKATAEETAAHLAKLNISKASPWILQQYIRGPEYCTHSVVIDGVVKVFVACPSAELLMHYVALPSDSSLSRAMLDFTIKFAAERGKGFTGHLSFDFMVDEADLEDPPTLYPIECNPRAHTAVVLFRDTPDMASAYTSILAPSSTTVASKTATQEPVTPQRQDRVYWVGHDLGALAIAPLLNLSPQELASGLRRAMDGALTFMLHLLTWKDGTFELWDPLPWFWLYHVYWPLQFAKALASGKRWSRINVSTTKMFGV